MTEQPDTSPDAGIAADQAAALLKTNLRAVQTTMQGSKPCHACGAPATVTWPRSATNAEAAAHWDALETNIRESGTPEYVQNRDDTVTIAVHGCDDHTMPDHKAGIVHAADCAGHGACRCEPASDPQWTVQTGSGPVTFQPPPAWPTGAPESQPADGD